MIGNFKIAKVPSYSTPLTDILLGLTQSLHKENLLNHPDYIKDTLGLDMSITEQL